MKIRNFHLLKRWHLRETKETTEWEKIFAVHMSNKELISRILKNKLLKSIKKQANNFNGQKILNDLQKRISK